MSIDFVPRHRVEVVSGGMERFLAQLQRSDFEPAPGMLATIVLEELPSGRRGYLFTAADLSEALVRVRRGDDPLGALGARSGGVPLVRPDEQPQGEAIVLGLDGVEGAWVLVQATGEWPAVAPDSLLPYTIGGDQRVVSVGEAAGDGDEGGNGEAEPGDAPADLGEAHRDEPEPEPGAEAAPGDEVAPAELPTAAELPAAAGPPAAAEPPAPPPPAAPRGRPASGAPSGADHAFSPAPQRFRRLTRRLRRTLDRGAGAAAPGGGGAAAELGRLGSGGAAPPSPGAEGDAAIRRTPHLDSPEQISTLSGSTFEVSVYTDSASLRPGEEGTDVVIDAPADVKAIDVGVVLLVTGHFSVHGDEYQVLTIERDASDSTPVRFTVEVSQETPEGNAAIQALFLYHGRSCGQVGREWTWEKGQPIASLVEPSGAAPASVPVHVEARSPDFSVFITAPVNDGMNFKCAVETPYIPRYERAQVTDFALPINSYDYVRRKLESLTDPRSTAGERRRALRRIGFELWDAAPKLMRDAFWELYDSNEPLESIYIASAEPNLPWELMIPNRPPTGDERPDELDPLGVAFAIGRWTRGDSESPPQQIPVRDAFIVAPEYPVKPLDTARERELLEERFNGTHVRPSNLDYLSYYFTSNHASLVHFACHGTAKANGDDAILLEDEQLLLAAEVRADEGFRALCRSKAPFVFLNACEAGQIVPALGGGAGFPFAFAMIGARAILAPLWPVDDQLAKEVAIELYKEALADDAPPVAEILRRIRARAYAQPDADTYAAYCFYGDPLARLELVSDG